MKPRFPRYLAMGGAEGRHMAQFERVLLRLSYVDAVRSGQNSHEFRAVSMSTDKRHCVRYIDIMSFRSQSY